ncbi:MAG: asparagine synthase (glutamine-hydrolyzing), partial [Planctomycetes bacterium]|nr:asparagine synthase (glutamine-hydrolyzing) [Planctomycetota bacterium]
LWVSPDGRVALGHRRLAVIDPAGGAQPMADPETGAVVVVNGEIYNYRQILGDLGRAPRTRSDTEALLAGYARHGRAIFGKLRGMFAGALHDPRSGELLLVRDRLGEKPLVYASLPGGGLAFASEIGALRLLLPGGPTLDEEALSLYLAFGYIPAPRTAFLGIRKLPPASFLAAGAAGPEVFWRRPPPGRPARDPREAVEEIRVLAREAVRSRLVADVPVGAFLSGGLDSSIVVALMAEAGGAVRTFTVRTPRPEYDEGPLARLVASRYGTRHEEIRIDPPPVEELPELLGRFGEPFGDSSAVAQALVCRAARGAVTVALTGDGGDEAFGGYDRTRILSRLGRCPRFLAAAAHPFLGGRLRRAAELASMVAFRRYYEFYECFNGGARERLLTPGFAARHGDAPRQFLRGLFESAAGGEADRMMATDFATWLPDDLNLKVDAMSMAVALECRAPFQDHSLVEACARVPAPLHLRGRGKALLRAAFGNRLPPEVLAGRKMGFAAPVEDWLAGDLGGFLAAKLEGAALRALDLVRPEAVRETIASLRSGSRTGKPRIRVWVLLALALFAESL